MMLELIVLSVQSSLFVVLNIIVFIKLVLQKSVFTGLFRDGVRRIDLVLVIDDDGYGKSEMVKVNFLGNIIKAGLDIEIEQAVLPKNANLLFVKIHAPAQIIHEYGTYFNVRRYFKESHIEFIDDKKSAINERELIKAMRKYDPESINYSTLERSTIVYRLLQMLPFGPYENYFGVKRLLKNRIIVDIYPLHDGPYFFLDKQEEGVVNGRQILFYTWLRPVFKMVQGQPLNIINEYLGGKVSFYFAFIEYYMRALFVVAVLSILMTFIAIVLPDNLKVIRNTCNPPDTLHSEICYVCLNQKWCPIRPTSDYCFKAHLAHVTHSIPVSLLCLFMGLWSIIFIILWSRRKNYLNWLWEINEEENAHAVRTEYTIPSEHVTSIKIEHTPIIRNTLQVLYNTVIYFLYFVFFGLITLIIMMLKHWLLYVIFGTQTYWYFYLTLAIISAFYISIAKMIERVNKRICEYLTDLEQIKTYASYEKSYLWKFFIVNMIVYLFLLFYYMLAAWYTFAHDPKYNINPSFKKTIFDEIRYLNCGPYGCTDEMTVIVIILVLVKEVLLKLPSRVGTLNTDYNNGKVVNAIVPCWEKEYDLCPLDEDFLNHKYMSLVLQFALGTYFVQACPLMPVLILFISLWDLRSNARFFLTGCRRPLVSNITGIGTWEQIISAVGYAVPIFNILCVAWCSQVIERLIYSAMKRDAKRGKPPKHYAKSYTTFFRYVTSSVSYLTCNFPIMLEARVPLNRYWEPRRWKWCIAFQYDHICVICKFVLRWIFPLQAKDVKDTMTIESDIKRKYYISKGITK